MAFPLGGVSARELEACSQPGPVALRAQALKVKAVAFAIPCHLHSVNGPGRPVLRDPSPHLDAITVKHVGVIHQSFHEGLDRVCRVAL